MVYVVGGGGVGFVCYCEKFLFASVERIFVAYELVG